MNKIMLLLLVCTGLVATVPMSAKALVAPQVVNQNLYGETNLLIAQNSYNRNQDRRFTVYYRSSNERRWTLEGSHTNRRDAERAANRLERRGYKTYVQMSREANRGMMGRDRGMMNR